MVDDDMFTALTFAITMRSEECVTILIEAGTDANRYHPRRISPLILAIRLNVEKNVRILVEAGADVNGQNAKHRFFNTSNSSGTIEPHRLPEVADRGKS